MEAVDKWDGCIFRNFWLDMFSDGRWPEHTKILSLSSALLISFDCSYE